MNTSDDLPSRKIEVLDVMNAVDDDSKFHNPYVVNQFLLLKII